MSEGEKECPLLKKAERSFSYTEFTEHALIFTEL